MSAVRKRHVGPLLLHSSDADVAEFAAAMTPDVAADTPPLVYAIRWLTLPDIRAALGELIDLATHLPLHEAQSFDCVVPLRSGIDYALEVELTREEGTPPRVSVTARLRDLAGTEVAQLTARLRAVALEGST